MAKILFISDAVIISTGFASVIRPIIQAAYNAGHEVKQIGWCYQGERHVYPYQIIAPTDFYEDYYGQKITKIICELWKPDIVFTLGDPWMVDWINKIPNRNTFKHIGYFPIDGVPFPDKWVEVIENMDIPVVYSQFAYDLVKEKMPNKDIRLILHGVNTNAFRPLSEDDIVEFKTKFELKDKYIIGCVARNQWRKNLPALFRAFEEFAKDKDDVVLYYHGAAIDKGWFIQELIKRYNMAGKFCFNKTIHPNYGIIQSDLNKIYNMFDVMSLSPLGEGFCLPIAEAHSCEIPVLVTNFSACPELTVSDQELIDVLDYYTPSNPEKGAPIDYALVDHKDYVRKLNWFYYNQEEAKEIGERGRQLVLEKLDVNLMTNSFNELFDEIMNKKGVE
jgi:glycosyltransferase involved in cell wall biosynthesis